MVNFREIYNFSRFQRGPTFSRGGGPTFSRGVQFCDFPGGGSGPLPPPSGSALASHVSLRLHKHSCGVASKKFNEFIKMMQSEPDFG